MKKLYFLAVTLLSFTFLNAQLLLNDDFDYGDTPGDLTTVSSGDWVAHSAGTPTVGYTNSGLSMSDYPASDFGATTITNDSDGESVNRSFTTVTTGKVYYSALVNLSTVGIGDSGFFMSLNSTSDNRAHVFAKDNGSNGINFGVISFGNNASIAWGSTDYDKDTTYLVVASYDIVTGVSNLFILTAPTTSEPGSPEATQTNLGTAPTISSVAIFQHDNGPVGIIDGLRVATDWEYLMFSIALNDGPPNGASITVSPETHNNAAIDFTTTSFTISNDDGGCTSDGTELGYIAWDVKDTSNDNVVHSGCIFTSNDPMTEYTVDNLLEGKTYLLTARLVDNDGSLFLGLDIVYTLTFYITPYTEVANLAVLRGSSYDDDIYFKVIGPVTNTYSRPGDFNQQYFQDETGGIPTGIMVYDEDDYIATYNEGDIVSNIKGQLFEIDGVLTLIPTEANWEAASDTIEVVPEEVTTTEIRDAFDSYESELVVIRDATFIPLEGIINFTLNTVHPINDGGAMNYPFRCSFAEADYIGDPIPDDPQDIVGLVIEFNGAPRIVARSMSDLTLDINDFDLDTFKIYPNPTSLGFVNIASKNNETISARVFDILGKQVINTIVANESLDVSNLTTGLYIMRLTQNNATVTKKLIIK